MTMQKRVAKTKVTNTKCQCRAHLLRIVCNAACGVDMIECSQCTIAPAGSIIDAFPSHNSSC